MSDGDNIKLTITEKKKNFIKAKKGKKECFIYTKQRPIMSVEVIIIDKNKENVVLLSEIEDGEEKLSFPGEILTNDVSAGELAVKIVNDTHGVKIRPKDLILYDSRSNPGRKEGEWLISTFYIFITKMTKNDYWGNINDIIDQRDDFVLDHYRVLQNLRNDC
jgi:ADP-ribose pyrophosphatase YjhB (NUDIX family)